MHFPSGYRLQEMNGGLQKPSRTQDLKPNTDCDPVLQPLPLFSIVHKGLQDLLEVTELGHEPYLADFTVAVQCPLHQPQVLVVLVHLQDIYCHLLANLSSHCLPDQVVIGGRSQSRIGHGMPPPVLV